METKVERRSVGPEGDFSLSVADPDLCTRLASLLQDALDVRTYGQHMYFSYRTDTTRSFQTKLKQQERWNQASASFASSKSEGNGTQGPLGQGRTPVGQGTASVSDGSDESVGWKYADRGYVFNRGLLEPFSGAGINGDECWDESNSYLASPFLWTDPIAQLAFIAHGSCFI